MARILVVDDRPDNLLMIERYLTSAGHEVEAVTDGERALERIVAGARFDLFLLDVVLPGMNGYELCERIRSRAETESTPVLFLTGERGQLPDKIRGFESGANDYLQKPVDESELLARVHVLLRLQSALTDVRDAKGQLEQLVEARTVELREALHSLERQRDLWEHAVHRLPAAVVICDATMQLLHCNDVAESTFASMTSGISLVQGPLAPCFTDTARDQLVAGGRIKLELVTSNGAPRIFEVELTLLEQQRLLLHLVDVTDREAVAAQADSREVAELRGRIQQLEQQLGSGYRMTQVLGHSAAMARVHSAVDQLRSSRVSVLISGESGTGKELVARAIHFDGDLRERPFVPVHCGAIPESLAESELFGYVKGAFTGAASDTKGLFEQADGGTIFLDEIGECSPELQSKLLRVVQSGEVRPVGATTVKNVNVRLIAATNRSLGDMVRDGQFREDLFYRLNVVQIDLPPLRDRIEDIPVLALHLLEKHAVRANGEPAVKGISREALAVLEAHTWDGNVRELENVIVRAIALSRAPLIQVEDLAPRIRDGAAAASGMIGGLGVTPGQAMPPRSGMALSGHGAPQIGMRVEHVTDSGGAVELAASSDFGGTAASRLSEAPILKPEAIGGGDAGSSESFLLPKLMADAERAAIVRALQAAKGNKITAAQLLGIGKSSLYRKIKELDIGLK